MEWLLFGYIVAFFLVSGGPSLTHIENLIGYGLAAGWIASVLMRRSRVIVPAEYWLVLTLVMWGLLSIIVGSERAATSVTSEQIRRWRTFVEVAALGLVALNVICRAKSASALELGFYSGILLSTAMVVVGPGERVLVERFAGGVGHPNRLGLAVAFGAAIAFGNLVRVANSASGLKRQIGAVSLLIGIQCVALWINVVLTGSRQGSMLSAAALGSSLCYLAFQGRSKLNPVRVVGVGLASVGTVLLIMNALQSQLAQRLYYFQGFVQGRGTDRSLESRSDFVGEALDLWAQQPVAGWGFDSFRHLALAGTHSHMNPAELLVTLGLVGFVLYYAMFSLTIYRLKRLRRPVAQLAAPGFIVIVLLVSGLAVPTYYLKVHWLLFAYVLWLVHMHGDRESAQVLSPATTLRVPGV